MYENNYHNQDLSQLSFLVTGGGGFIGSNIVEYLLKYNAKRVRVLDDFSNGHRKNLAEFHDNPSFELIEGDIRDLQTCKNAMKDISKYDDCFKRVFNSETNGLCRFEFYLWR